LQIIGQNPQLLGVGVPGQPTGEEEMGAEPGGPSPELGNEQPPGGEQLGEQPLGGEIPGGSEQGRQPPATGKTTPLSEPSREDVKRYDLDIEDYSREADAEDIDFSMEI